MNEANKKTNRDPQSYSPAKPEILSLAKEFAKQEIDNMIQNHIVELIGIEYIDIPAMRFIGKDVKDGGGEAYGAMWGKSGEFMPTLDAMTEYATLLTDPCALMHFSNLKHDDPGGQMHYLVGKFMRADTPVPDGFDYWDIAETMIGLGIVYGEFNDAISKAMMIVHDKIVEDGYAITYPDNYFHAEVYVKENIPEGGVISKLGYLHACKRID